MTDNTSHSLSPEPSVRERARTRALFSSIGDGILATDARGNISEVNSAAVRILGYHAEELLGQWLPRIISAVDEDGKELDLLERPVTQAMVSGKPIAEKTFYLTKTGQQIPVSVTVSPILVNDRPVGAIEVFRDISHEYEVDRMKSEFISIASHQLRTPLTAIKTYAHMLDSGFGGKLNSRQKDLLDIILGSADRMNELINTLLDIARIEEGRLTITARKINLRSLIKDVLTELRPLAREKHISIKTSFQTPALSTSTDPLLVKEVCLNLLSNALKYTPENGEVRIDVTNADTHFSVAITDTGYGIPHKEQRRVFSKFFRAENILDKQASGTGLGLYLVKQVIESMGGTVSFSSTEGKGSCFTFTLPRA